MGRAADLISVPGLPYGLPTLPGHDPWALPGCAPPTKVGEGSPSGALRVLRVPLKVGSDSV